MSGASPPANNPQPSPQATWSQRFEGSLHPAIVRFNASIEFDIELIEYDLTGSQAHAQMLAKQGIISDAEATELVNGLEQMPEPERVHARPHNR